MEGRGRNGEGKRGAAALMPTLASQFKYKSIFTGGHAPLQRPKGGPPHDRLPCSHVAQPTITCRHVHHNVHLRPDKPVGKERAVRPLHAAPAALTWWEVGKWRRRDEVDSGLLRLGSVDHHLTCPALSHPCFNRGSGCGWVGWSYRNTGQPFFHEVEACTEQGSVFVA